ncbi:MAG: hypothetical protein CL583_15365 [Alteromonadaceae bacterium]|nr:hypothetical protein [Alteromonadaceae bacterium]
MMDRVSGGGRCVLAESEQSDAPARVGNNRGDPAGYELTVFCAHDRRELAELAAPSWLQRATPACDLVWTFSSESQPQGH